MGTSGIRSEHAFFPRGPMLNPFSDIAYDWQEFIPLIKEKHGNVIIRWMILTTWTVEHLRHKSYILKESHV